MPGAIERSVRRQNIQFMHNKAQFSAEYFQFIRKLVVSNTATFQSMNPHGFSKVRIKDCMSNSAFLPFGGEMFLSPARPNWFCYFWLSAMI